MEKNGKGRQSNSPKVGQLVHDAELVVGAVQQHVITLNVTVDHVLTLQKEQPRLNVCPIVTVVMLRVGGG